MRRTLLSLAFAGCLIPLSIAAQPATTITVQPGGSVDIRVPNIIVPQAPRGRAITIRPAPQAVEIASVDATVDLRESVATTTLRMTVKNPASTQQEAEMLVPVPHGAAIRSFGFDGPGQEPTAKLLPRDEARRIYEEIVRRSLDPALLEFVNCSFVRSSVFPVPANGESTITLTYENVLNADSAASAGGARIDFVLPRSGSLEASGTKWTSRGRVVSERVIGTVYSPSHPLSATRISDKEQTFEVPAAASGNAGAFRVSVLLGAGSNDPLPASVLLYPDTDASAPAGSGYFMFLGGVPALPAEAQHRTPKREVTLVIDRSGSMRGEKWEQARNAAVAVIEGLNDGEAFSIIDYSDTVARFGDGPVIKDAATLADGRAYLNRLRAEGGTNIHEALQQALRQPVTPGFLPLVVFLTDGLPTVGITDEARIRDDSAAANTSKRRVFTFGVGYDLNAPLLDRLAEATRAASINVLPGESIENSVSRVFRRLAGPVMNEPALTARHAADPGPRTPATLDVLPARLPDLFEGDQLVVLGRYSTTADGARLRLEGEYLGQRRTFEFALDPARATTANAFVPRLWASRKIAFLLDEVRQAGVSGDVRTDPRTKELIDAVVKLSMRWGILTEYTSFLAEDPSGTPVAATTHEERLHLAMDAAAGRLMERAGAGAVNQSVNLKTAQAQACANADNTYWDANMQQVRVLSVMQVADQTLFCRGGKWFDSNLVDKPEMAKPDMTIEFGSAEHFALACKLAETDAGAGRQALLAQRGDVYLLVDGKRVLVRGATGN